jgi:hypothetical protein
MGIKIYNHLLAEIKSVPDDIKSFKFKSTAFLLQNSFYSLNSNMTRNGIIINYVL